MIGDENEKKMVCCKWIHPTYVFLWCFVVLLLLTFVKCTSTSNEV